MRAVRRRRPPTRALAKDLKTPDLGVLAELASYVGSVEHKDTPSFSGKPRPRADASICDRSLRDRQEDITEWLRDAIRSGHVSQMRDGKFPRYAWHRQGNVMYEARVINREQGEYKGYPLNKDEWPEGLK